MRELTAVVAAKLIVFPGLFLGLGALLGRPVSFLPEAVGWTEQMEAVVINIRLPRILLACLVGCCLSSAGVAYQSVFQNPMAAPDILGASSGACFGAALAILTGQSTVMVTVFAFLASLPAFAQREKFLLREDRSFLKLASAPHGAAT